jgi:hypothetical protein
MWTADATRQGIRLSNSRTGERLILAWRDVLRLIARRARQKRRKP